VKDPINDYGRGEESGKGIVTDMVDTLPGNRSVNTVQYATIEEAVFFCKFDRRSNRVAR
jgi:hypothetical protein